MRPHGHAERMALCLDAILVLLVVRLGTAPAGKIGHHSDRFVVCVREKIMKFFPRIFVKGSRRKAIQGQAAGGFAQRNVLSCQLLVQMAGSKGPALPCACRKCNPDAERSCNKVGRLGTPSCHRS